jgi:putative transposase
MARLPRLSIAGCPQHIIQRGNNRQACFFTEQDYTVYLDKLKDSATKHNVSIHAFVLMTNHVHLLMTAPSNDGISQVMQNLGRYYVRYVNQTYQRTGTLWEGRFKSTLVDTESYLLTLYRYIELNPVRARMVEHPAAYPWSSYQGNAGDRNITLLTPHPVYLALGNTKVERKSAYQSLFLSHLSDKTIQAIRDATNKAWALGDESFIEQVANTLSRRAKPLPQGGDRRSKVFNSSKMK